MAFKNRIRLPFILNKPQFPVEKNVFRKADGSSKLLSAVIRNTYEGKTDQLPEDWHRKLVIALAHENVTIEDKRFITDVVLEGDYGISWQDFLNYPIAEANFTIQTTPFNASANNCQSCSEVTQLNLVDDYTDDIWDEGTTNEYPDIITANDSICCYPYTIEIVTFNTLYFTSVTVTDECVLTVVVKDPVPILDDVFVCTYRVTCENGGYDEADVYGNITGTSTECPQVSNLDVTLDTENDTIATVSWTEPSPAPSGGYDWFLYNCADIYTVVQSGSTSSASVNLTDLEPGECYIFAIKSKCEFDISDPVTIEFTLGGGGRECGIFQIGFFGSFATADFVNCSGGSPEHYEFLTSGVIVRCLLLQTGTHTPVLFESTAGVTLTYITTCG